MGLHRVGSLGSQTRKLGYDKENLPDPLSGSAILGAAARRGSSSSTPRPPWRLSAFSSVPRSALHRAWRTAPPVLAARITASRPSHASHRGRTIVPAGGWQVSSAPESRPSLSRFPGAQGPQLCVRRCLMPKRAPAAEARLELTATSQELGATKARDTSRRIHTARPANCSGPAAGLLGKPLSQRKNVARKSSKCQPKVLEKDTSGDNRGSEKVGGCPRVLWTPPRGRLGHAGGPRGAGSRPGAD